eukprot:1136149-Pelagomonas_calceolata.AAC.1
MASWTIFQSDAVLELSLVETVSPATDQPDIWGSAQGLQLTFPRVWLQAQFASEAAESAKLPLHLLLQLSCPCRQ